MKLNMKKYVEHTLFDSKWLLTIFYAGLIFGQICSVWVYVKEIFHIMYDINLLNKETIMLAVLELVDMVMIANLIKMIIAGSYNSMVDKDHGYANENISSGMMKVKMGSTLIGVTSIHLLQSFINYTNISWDDLYKQLLIHGVFVVGAIALSWMEYLHDLGDSINPHDNDGVRKQHNLDNDQHTQH